MSKHACKTVVNGVLRGGVLPVRDRQSRLWWGSLISWTGQNGRVNQPRARLTDLLQRYW